MMVLGNNNLHLEPHSSARSQAVSNLRLAAGATIVSVPALTTVLIQPEKGQRCDCCFRAKNAQRSLRKCTGCGSYWYCDPICQNVDWAAQHKKVCKAYNNFTSSSSFQSLAAHERMDCLLLNHLLAQIISSTVPSVEGDASPLTIFRSLLPNPISDIDIPPVCSLNSPVQSDLIRSLYLRFGNNNFAVHSHLDTVGHGIFPLASRLFNHSCVPNAAARYVFSGGCPVTMQIVALRSIAPGEEICIPYLDPALLQTRQQIFDLTYGFRCKCSSCSAVEACGPIPSPPKVPEELRDIGRCLREYVGPEQSPRMVLPDELQRNLPLSLRCVLHETYLSDLSETFSRASHEGNYDIALDTGVTLWALYTLIYPPNYPQIGMHLLEMAKTAWNMTVSGAVSSNELNESAGRQMRLFLSLSKNILSVLGSEGDEGGPLQEIGTLTSLLGP